MRVITKVVLQMTDDPLVYIPVSADWYDYEGPIAHCKGGGANQAATALQKQTDQQGVALSGTGENIQNSELIPYLSSEMASPTGLGAQTLSQAQTASGEAIGGAQGAATKSAMDVAARTGNFGSIPSIIDNTARTAGQTQSTNALDLATKNREMQLQQSQAGASGLGTVASGDIGAASSMFGESSKAIQDMLSAEQLMQSSTFQDIGAVAGIGSSIGTMFAPTGSSTAAGLGMLAGV